MTEHHGGHPRISHIWSSDQALHARIRQIIAHPSSVKLIKYASVSLISTVVSQVTLILLFGVFHVLSEVPANIVANVLATVLRYTLYRSWVFRGRSAPPLAASPARDPGAPQPSLATVAQPDGSI